MTDSPLRYSPSEVFPSLAWSVQDAVFVTISRGVLKETQQNQTAVLSPMCELCYSQSGPLQGQVGKTQVQVKPGFASIGFMGAAKGQAVYAGGTTVELLSVWLQPQSFNRFSQMVSDRVEYDFSRFQSEQYRQYEFKSDPRELWLIRQLLRLSAPDPTLSLNRMLAEAYVQELVAINLERLFLPEIKTRQAEVSCSKTEWESLRNLPQLLTRQLQQPPSLPELARQLQMNDCKLKKLFKLYYGTTIYGYIRQQRMEQAFRLLQTGQYNVSQAAAAVGYSNLSHFAATFKETYGVNPREIRF